MKQLFFFLLLVGLSCSLHAQYKGVGEVELLELDETTATFRAEGLSDKMKGVLEAATKNLFYKLFYEGVEGFNDDQKLVEQEKKFWLDNFFKGGDRAPYNGFVKGIQLDGAIETLPTKEYRGFANIVVNYESLIRTLKINHIIVDEETQKVAPEPKEKREFGIGVRNKD